MTDTPAHSSGDFPFNPPADFWKRLAERHKIADITSLQSAVVGPLISAKAGRNRTRYTHTLALSTTKSMLNALGEFKELCESDIYLTQALMRKDTDEPGQLNHEKADLAFSFQAIERRLLDTQSKLQSHAFVSALIHQGRGRPKNDKHAWLRELWNIFCDHSPQRGKVNRGKSELGEYSGDFYEFVSSICAEAGISIGSYDLATSIQRIIR